jgi:Domain of unknown function (DUF4331)
MKRLQLWIPLAAGLALASGLALHTHRSQAADHLDPPGRVDPAKVAAGTTADREADIADVFAWHRNPGAAQSVVLAMTFSGPNAPAAYKKLGCDKDVLYTINIDNSMPSDGKPDLSITARFGKDDKDNCFVRFDGVPGISSSVVVRTEATTEKSGAKFYVGLRDDAFFFDLQGFRDTFATGLIKMTNDRDFFKGLNTPVIALELPAAAVGQGKNQIRVWATTARHP